MSPDRAIFLSAGIPDPNKSHFMGEADPASVSAVISALLYVTLGRRKLVWGGHPSITPMVWAYAEALAIDYGAWVKLYQSDFFQDDFPDETAKFNNVVITPRVEGDVTGSLAAMRQQMLADTAFGAAIFVGGMRGIMDEYALFKELAPQAAILPIMSAGGAARVLGQQIGAPSAFATQLDYVALLHEQLEIDPKEPRYATPAEQPAALAERRGHPPA